MTDIKSQLPSIGPGLFRSVLGQYPTGVTAITTLDQAHDPVGMVVGTFSSVSLDPPLVSYMPSKDSSSFALLRTSSRFCVNILSGDQEDICRAFAVKGAADKFAGIPWISSPLGNPIIEGATAWIDCEIRDVIDAGDHYIVIGEVKALAPAKPALPLLFLGGGYGRFSPRSRVIAASPDLTDQLRLADAARSPMESLTRSIGMECAAVAPVEDVLVRIASAGSPAEGSSLALVGLRLPFEAPMGALFVAWDSEAVQDRWLRRAAPQPTQDEAERHRAALAHVRKRGWTITLHSDAFRELDDSLATLATLGPSEDREAFAELNSRLSGTHAYDVPDLDPTGSYDVRNVSVPVFGPTGTVVMYLSIFGFPPGTQGTRVIEVAEQLEETAARISHALPSVPYDDDKLNKENE